MNFENEDDEIAYVPTNREKSQHFTVAGSLIFDYECSNDPITDMKKDLKKLGKSKPKYSYKNYL